MRILVFILALLGGLASGALGFIWKTAWEEEQQKPQVKLALEMLNELDSMDEQKVRTTFQSSKKEITDIVKKVQSLQMLIYALMGGGAVALVGGIFALRRLKWLALILLLAPVGACVYFVLPLQPISQDIFTIALAANGPLALGGLLCFLIKPVKSKDADREFTDEDEQEEPKPRGASQKKQLFEDEVPPPFEDAPPEPAPKKVAVKAAAPPPQEEAPAGPVVALFKCPECGKTLKKTDPQAGKPIKCPGCATTFPTPAAAVQKARAEARKGQQG